MKFNRVKYAAWFCLVAGVVLLRQAGSAASLNQGLAEIYHRTTNVFDVADLFKPAGTNDEDLAFKFAPLIFQEVRTNAGASVPAKTDVFGALIVGNGRPRFDPSRPTVYFDADSVRVKGEARIRFSYFWFYPAGSDSQAARLGAQGVRLTLDSSGQPAVWEVLADTRTNRLLFVSQSLETAAKVEFGKPLPGRRQVVEDSLQRAPHTVVARVIDEGPVPMGPIVYLAAGTRDTSTVICRCMAAQAKVLSATSSYDLVPLQGAATRPWIESALRQTPFWEGSWAATEPWESRLRLPRKF